MHILHSGSPSNELAGLAGLFQATGLRVDMVDLAAGPVSCEAFAGLGASGLVIDSTSLSNTAGASDALRQYIATGAPSAVLLFVSDAADDTCRFLDEVTSGTITGARPWSGETAHFTSTEITAVRELAGCSFPRNQTTALQFIGNGVEEILQIDGEPSFGAVREGRGSRVFVWSTCSVFDVTRPLSSELEFECSTDEYVPGIVFARTAAGAAAWHNPSPNASLIIDDPLLQPRYGHIHFRTLLESARSNSYSVTLAFIPWNHWRTRRRNTALFNDYDDVFSVCVHGNDHTAAEFESGSYEELRRRATQAIERMEKHRSRTGIGYVPVMVCPQERYSVDALRAIGSSGKYLAVANSRLIPNVPDAVGQVTGADLMQPAMDAWSSSALLKRHYPADGIEKIALTLFLGRPIILSEHHGYFATGTERIEEMAETLERLCPKLTWKPLGDMIRTLRWQRQVGEDSWQVRFFADEFNLEPMIQGPVSYQLERRSLAASPITNVSVQGRDHVFEQEENRIWFEIQGSDTVSVELGRDIEKTERVRAASFGHNAGVALRRGLSELRDRSMANRDRAASLLRPVLRGKLQAQENKQDH